MGSQTIWPEILLHLMGQFSLSWLRSQETLTMQEPRSPLPVHTASLASTFNGQRTPFSLKSCNWLGLTWGLQLARLGSHELRIGQGWFLQGKEGFWGKGCCGDKKILNVHYNDDECGKFLMATLMEFWGYSEFQNGKRKRYYILKSMRKWSEFDSRP